MNRAALMLAMLTIGFSPAMAGESVPAPEVTPDGETKPVTAEGDAPQGLTPDPLIPPADDPAIELEEVAAAMDRAATSLDKEEPAADTLAEQQAAIDRLRTLLKAASKQKSKSSSSRSSESKSTDDSQDQQKPGSEDSPPNAPQEGGGRRADDQNSKESSEGVSGPNAIGDGSLASGVRATAVWGHLPKRDQAAVMRTLTESILPEYAAQIQDYYKAIAEGR